ncbi:MAG TPA: PAS domain-containing protein, partial [Spirochaetia bacterium]|nr:PAS domain-containing protein [Spirochaetia bacterium]
MCSSGWTTRRVWIGAFSALALVVVVAAAFSYRRAHEQARSNGYREIASISRLKADRIEAWRKERLADAIVAADNPFLRNAVRAWRGSGVFPADATSDLTAWLTLVANDDKYADALLCDAGGRVILSTGADRVGPETTAAIARVVSSRQPGLGELYRGEAGGIFLDAAAPVVTRADAAPAVLVLRMDAKRTLFPLVQSWPSPSPTAETLLVRRDGSNVLFLNELRFASGTALTLKVPLVRTDIPAAQVVAGKRGIFEGRDYRGTAVLADLLPIAGSPWFIVSKVAIAEIYSEANYRTLIILTISALVILLGGAGAAFGLRHRQAQLYRSLLEAERKEREIQREFRTTLYSIGDAVIGTDTDGAIWHMNREAERLTQWTENEAKGKKLEEVFRIISEQTRQGVECPVSRVLKEGAVVGLANHTLLVARDGSERPIADSGSPIRDEDGTLKGVVLVFRDQSEEHAAHRALEESEERYRSLVQNLGVGIASADPEDVLTFANPAAEAIFGVVPGGLAGRGLNEFLSEAEFGRVRRETAKRRQGERNTYQITITRADGEERQVQLTAVPQRGPNGAFAGTFGTMEDITERCRAESALARQMELLQTLMDTVPDYIYFKDREGRFILNNRANAEHFRTGHPSELVGKTDFDFFSRDHAQSASEDDQQVIATGQPLIDLVERETWPDRPDSWVSTTKMPLRNERGEIIGTFGVSRDVTERRMIEEALKESEEHYRNTFMNAPFGVFHSTME